MSASSTNRIKTFFVASTHWDREWYETFQSFRYHLVEMMDELLDVMVRDKRFACFHTDGQSIPVEDYLEIRPERADLVRRLAAAGRLRIGPWYAMPDEHIIGGEALIRNLAEGLRVAEEYGYASRVGFVCDMFGHIAQLPQIFRGFGIDSAFIFRGINEDTHRGAFRWRGSDGSELLAHNFGPKNGYFDYGFEMRSVLDPSKPFEVEEVLPRLVEYVRMQHQRMGCDVVLLFDGGDHMPIEPQTPDLLARLRKAMPELDVRHAGLEEFIAALRAQGSKIDCVCTGELRAPGRLADGRWVIPGVLSSRVRLKLDNRARETELCWWAEPFSHLANLLAGVEYPHSYLRHAWRYVLANNAHDSICGCSPDQIHKDMEYRFDQARLISDKVITHALRAIAQRVELPDLAGEEFALAVFNPTQTEINGPVDLELWFDEKTKSLYAEFFGYENKVGFRLYDADGRELPYDYRGYDMQRRRFHRPHRKTPFGQECIVVHVTVPLRIPAFGYTTITCRPEAARTRHPAGHLVAGDRALENEHLRVAVNDNGSLTLLDKRTGQTYDRLLVFEDRADIGDGWYHGVAVNDRILSSTACPADVAVVADGAGLATLRITNRLAVPECFEWALKMRRSVATTTLVIDNCVTLRAGADHVEIRTVIDNNVRDHRIRVLFESGVQAETYLADSAFDVIERPIALPADNHTYKELVVETTPQANWTAVFRGRRGLAVVAPGLLETTVRDVPARPIALTLLRGFRRTIFTDGEEGGQSLGRHEFRYRLVPLGGAPDRTRLTHLAQQTASPPRGVQVLPRDQAPAAERTLPRTHGQLMLSPGRLIVSAFRRRPDSKVVELRLFNPEAKPVRETVHFDRPVRTAKLADLQGNKRGPATVKDGLTIELKARPKEIVTVLVELAARPRQGPEPRPARPASRSRGKPRSARTPGGRQTAGQRVETRKRSGRPTKRARRAGLGK